MWILMQSVGEVATLFPVHGGFVEVRCYFQLLEEPRISNRLLLF
jgi:amino acid permease